MIFENILGNEKNKELLKKILITNSVSHSYMFIGEESTGKMLFAKEFAKGILCENKDNRPCNNCISCVKFDNLNHPDFIVIDEKEETIKNDQIREMNRNILEKPIESNKKVYIINNSENMTQQAQNSLLKTLEEPPEHAVIILITKDDNRMLNTIKSRCTKINFIPLTNLELKEVLSKNFGIENTTRRILELANGSVKRAVELNSNDELYSKLENIFANLNNIDLIDFLKHKEQIAENKEQINTILDFINVILFEKYNQNSKYLSCISIVEETKERLEKNSNFDMTIDRLLSKIWEEING